MGDGVGREMGLGKGGGGGRGGGGKVRESDKQKLGEVVQPKLCQEFREQSALLTPCPSVDFGSREG